MKVGLLTFHSAHNYGAVLQAYATQVVIENMGHNIEVIDYRPPYLIRQPYFPSLKGRSILIRSKIIIEGLICLFWRFRRRRAFDNFISKKLLLSNNRYNSQNISSIEGYDTFIMGSDQIWNLKLSSGFDDVYWGNFKTKNKARKITYAASMSNYLLNEEQKKTMTKYLNNFHSVSVREEELKEFLLRNFRLGTTTVLDPTFLLKKHQWMHISKKPIANKKYVLVYSISLRDEVYRIAKLIANQLNTIIIELTLGVDKRVLFNRYQTATPEEFLGLFENAQCVVTSSFHGTSFSIIYNIPFYSIAHGTDKDTRQITILEKLGLLERFLPRGSEPDFQSIDYKPVNAKVEKLRNNSIDFLKSSLSGS